MTDLITGLVFAAVLVLVGALLVNHSKKSREAMLEEMDRLEKLEEEKAKAEAEAKAKKAKAEPKDAKPAPKKRRGRPKKSNGKKEMD